MNSHIGPTPLLPTGLAPIVHLLVSRMKSSITRWVRDEKSADVKPENKRTKSMQVQPKLRHNQLTKRSLSQSKLSPRNNLNFEFLELLGVNQLHRSLLLAGEEIGDFEIKLLNVIWDARKPVVLGGSLLWRTKTVPIPYPTSEIEF
jgi:hypothetical protein